MWATDKFAADLRTGRLLVCTIVYLLLPLQREESGRM